MQNSVKGFKQHKLSQTTLEQCICKMIILTEQLLDSRLRNVESLVEENKQNLRNLRRAIVNTQKRVFTVQEGDKENFGISLMSVNQNPEKHRRVSIGITSNSEVTKPNLKPYKPAGMLQPPTSVNPDYRPIQVQVPIKNSDRSVVQMLPMRRNGSKSALSRGSSKSHLHDQTTNAMITPNVSTPVNCNETSAPECKESSNSSHPLREAGISTTHSGSSKPAIQTTSSQRHERLGVFPSPQTANLLQDCAPMSETCQSSSQNTPPVRLPMHESLESFRHKQLQRKRQLELLEALQDQNVLHKIDTYSHLSWVLESDAQIKKGKSNLGESELKGPSSDSLGAQSNQTFGAPNITEEIKLEEYPERTSPESNQSPQETIQTEQLLSLDKASKGFIIPETTEPAVLAPAIPNEDLRIAHRASVRQGVQSRDKTRNKKETRNSKTREKINGSSNPKPGFPDSSIADLPKKKAPVSSLATAASDGSKKYYDQLLKELEVKERSKSRTKPLEAVKKPKSVLKARSVAAPPEPTHIAKEIPEWSIKDKVSNPESKPSQGGVYLPNAPPQDVERSSSEEYDLVGANMTRPSQSPALRSAKRSLLTVSQHAPSAHQFEELPSGTEWKKKLAFEDNIVTSKKGSATRTEKEVDQLVEAYMKETGLQKFPNTALKGLMGDNNSAKPSGQDERSELNTSVSSLGQMATRTEGQFNTDLESARYAHKILNKFAHKDLSLKGLFDGLAQPLSSDN